MKNDTLETKPLYLRLNVQVHEEASSLVQEALLLDNVLGLEIEDDDTRAWVQKPFKPSHQVLIKAIFHEELGLKKRFEDKIQAIASNALIRWEVVNDEDWVNNFQSSWKSFTLGNNIWIIPSWEAEKFKLEKPDSILLYMDPGMAFGTGHHETTQLCALSVYENIKKHPKSSSMKVLDVGTGTGILAMIAAKMGVFKAVGIDNDPEAIRVALENCAHNKLSEQINILNQSPDFMGSYFDLVVANILANPLIEMAEQITHSLAPKGTLLLSGILDSQEEAVKKAYWNQGLSHLKTIHQGEWVLIEFKKQ